MKLAFMTLGCPNWTLDEICSRGPALGFDAVDFRGLGPELDITRLPAFTSGLSQTRRQLDSAGLGVSAISTSLNICNAEKRQSNLEEARRTIPAAIGLGAKNLRVFGGGWTAAGSAAGSAAGLAAGSRESAADCGAACMAEILQLDGAQKLNWLFETHDEWIRSENARMLIDRVCHPAFGVLWDTGHTYRITRETPATTFANLGPWVRYIHIKDAVHDPAHPKAMADGWRYVPPGTGELPLAESIRILRQSGYDGFLTFEHEKRWHPETLAEPEDVFPAFIEWVRPLLSSPL